MTLFHIHYGDDLFEISLRGYIITRITVYSPTCHRRDVQYDDCPEDVQDKILSKVAEALKNSR